MFLSHQNAVPKTRAPASARPGGFILLPVVIAIAVIAAVAFLINSEGAMNVNRVGAEVERAEARLVAQAGLNRMLWQSNRANCSGYTNLTNIPLGPHSFSATIFPTSGSPVAVNATGNHVRGSAYTINRTREKIYQFPNQTLLLQPDPSAGVDTYFDEWKATWNYGLNSELQTEYYWSNSKVYSLLKFDLSGVPQNSHIVEATLSLYQNTPSSSGGFVSVHRILQSWEEGTKSNGIGTANWQQRDAVNAWTTAGGDYSTAAAASRAITGGVVGWNQWDIRSLVENWVSGAQPNEGIILIPSAGTGAYFHSSDYSNAALRPKLTVRHTCECGAVCSLTPAANDLLLVVVDPAGLTVQESRKKTIFESWDYTVSLIDVDDSQSAFDAAVASNDVVYITEDINSGSLGTKLVGATIGVVTEEDNLSDEFGLSSTITWGSGNSLNVVDNSHYITQPFALGNLTIMTVTGSLANLTGTRAPHLKTLGSNGGGPLLATLEAGATTYTAGTAAGRRVQLPWGGNNFDVDTLTADGLTLLRRSLEWGAETPIPNNKLLLVVPDAASLTSQDAAKKSLIESWGFQVNLISGSDAQSVYDAAVAAADVVYISEEVLSSDVNTKLRDASIGIVIEETALVDEFGITDTRGIYSSTDIQVIDNTHYITSSFATGALSIVSSSQELNRLTGTLAPGLDILSENSGLAGLVTLEQGSVLFDSGTAAGRRVQLPWGGNTFDINALNADGQIIMRRSIEWASGLGGGGTNTIEVTVGTDDDDAEEAVSDGDMNLSSSDLELVYEGSNHQYVGMRFTGITIPQGATISNAFIQFQVDETDSGATNVTFRIQDTDNAATFTSTNYNISSRAVALPSVNWSPVPWTTVGARGADQRTPDLSPLIQAVVDRPGWNSGNALVIIVTGSGERTAESYDGNSSGAPMLHIEY